jgi:hypothetical protein
MSRKQIVAFPVRTSRDTIREEHRHEQRRRVKYFWRWASNQRLLVLAWILTAAIVMINCGQLLIAGGNGIPFTGAMLGFLGLLAGLFQLSQVERGYEVRDWLPQAVLLGGRRGW